VSALEICILPKQVQIGVRERNDSGECSELMQTQTGQYGPAKLQIRVPRGKKWRVQRVYTDIDTKRSMTL